MPKIKPLQHSFIEATILSNNFSSSLALMSKIFFLINLLMALLACDAIAQKNDFGFWAGGANYFGDLNTQTSFHFTNPAGGIFYRYNFDERISARVNLNVGRVWADDAYSDDYYQTTRNLGFSSNILESSAHLEFNFLPYSLKPYASINNKQKYTPYLLAGLGVFHFNPMVKYNNQKVQLQPLGTEGQGY
ncbi:MAG: outer membrane beta-barrel protein, partial [Chitinophagales bacterium]|nr:outer membrane beta-barrel protein [Chitinophagales bacterium]